MTRVELDKQDMWNQIRQSMTINFGKPELHFPLAISPDLSKFAILGNLYSIEARSSQARNSTPHVQVIEYHLPIHFDGIQPPSWPEGKTPIQIFREASNTWGSKHIPLRYSLTFSEHGTRIFFLAHVVNVQMIHAAVFDVKLSDSGSISLAGPVQSFPCDDYVGSWSQVMHQSYPLVAFAGGSDIFIWVYFAQESALRFRMPWPLEKSDPRVRLWKFSIPTTTGDARVPGDRSTQTFSSLPFSIATGIVETNVASERSTKTVSSLAFSPDGLVLFASCTDRDTPFAIPIPQHVLNTCGEPSAPAKSSNILKELQPSLGAALYKPSSSSVSSHLRSEAYQITPDGKMRGISARKHNGNVEIQLSEQGISGDAERLKATAQIDVVALPDRWRDTGKSTVSLQMPKADDMTMRVIVNREGELSYNMQSDGDHDFPIVIDRDVRSLRIASGNNLGEISAQGLLLKELDEDRTIVQDRAMDNVDNATDIDKDDCNDGGISLDYLDTGCESDYGSNGWESD